MKYITNKGGINQVVYRYTVRTQLIPWGIKGDAMVELNNIEQQLKDIGCNFRFFGRPEVRELAKVIMPTERIANAVNGFYEGGYALLVVTDQRLLLIDRKPMYLTIEDVRFDMIAEIDFNHRLLNANVRIFSTNKTMSFTCWNSARLRSLVENLQHHVMQYRFQPNRSQLPALQAQFVSQATPVQYQIPAAAQYEESPLPEPISATVRGQRTLPHLHLRAPSVAQLALQGAGQPNTSTAPAATNRMSSSVPPLSRRRKFPNFN